MELLVEDGSIAKRIRRIKPTHIATAYIGRDWHDHVDAKALKSVVLSPTLGSSASAVWDLVKILGWDKVHFLEELHAKFYWTPNAAVLGSSNLSNNGLQGSRGLVEAAVAMNIKEHPKQLSALKAMHRRLVGRAKTQYGTIKAKRDRLKWLEDLQHRASLLESFPRQGISRTKASSHTTSLKEFDPAFKKQRIHIIGWGHHLKHDKEALQELMPMEPSKALRHAQQAYITLQSKANVKRGDWIISWQTESKSWSPKVNGYLKWLHVDYVLPSSACEGASEKWVAYECRSTRKDEVPFELTDTVKEAIRSLLGSGKFSELCPMDEDEKWSIKAADIRVPDFLRALKKKVARVK